MAEREGLEPPCRLPGKTLSRRPRYDHGCDHSARSQAPLRALAVGASRRLPSGARLPRAQKRPHCCGRKMAEREGFEPPCRLPGKTLSRRPRYDHFGTSPALEPLILLRLGFRAEFRAAVR